MPSADFCPALRLPLDRLSRRRDTGQLSWGKLSRLPCTVAESTLRALDGYGLRGKSAARPALAPSIRFLSIDSHVCSVLPSDPASRRWPLHIARPSPPSGWARDSHPQAAERAQHTTKPLRGGGTARRWAASSADGIDRCACGPRGPGAASTVLDVPERQGYAVCAYLSRRTRVGDQST